MPYTLPRKEHSSFIGYSVEDDLVMLRDTSTQNIYKKFPVKTSGNGDKIIDMNAGPTFSMSTYDPQKRSWYIGANKSYTEFARSGKLIPFW